MSEMVERVARELARYSGWSRPWGDMRRVKGEAYVERFFAQARVAVAAMREPTDAVAMAVVGESPIKRRDEIAAVSVGAQLWRDAIDAALKEA